MENQQDMQGRRLRPESTLWRGPPAYEPRTAWRPGRALAATLLIIALGAAVAAVAMIVFWAGTEAPASLPGRGMSGAEARVGVRMFAVWQAAVVLLTILASGLLRGRVRDVLALHHAASGWRAYLGAVLALVALQAGLALLQHTIVRHDVLTDLRPFVDLIRGPEWLLTAAVIGIGAPLSEELLFRGFLLSALARSSLGFWGAAVVSTALWTALHFGYSLAGIIEVFVIGLFFSWLLWRSGSLWVPIFCHAVYNSLIVLVLRFVDLPAPA